MNIVSTMATKDERIYVRVSADIKEEFETVADFRGLKPATLLHTLIVKTIYEAKKENPEIFDKPRSEPDIPVKTLEEAKADDERKRHSIKGTK